MASTVVAFLFIGAYLDSSCWMSQGFMPDFVGLIGWASDTRSLGRQDNDLHSARDLKAVAEICGYAVAKQGFTISLVHLNLLHIGQAHYNLRCSEFEFYSI